VRSPVCAQGQISNKAGDRSAQNQSFRLGGSLEFQETTLPSPGKKCVLSLTVASPGARVLQVAPAQAYVSLDGGPVLPAPSMAPSTRCPCFHSNQPEGVFRTRHLINPHRVPPGPENRPTAHNCPTFTFNVNLACDAHHKLFPEDAKAAWAGRYSAGKLTIAHHRDQSGAEACRPGVDRGAGSQQFRGSLFRQLT